MKVFVTVLLLLLMQSVVAQYKIDSVFLDQGVKITLDTPIPLNKKKNVLIFYALPNGNTTAQTMGKKMTAGQDWHFDIQHIKAQTDFIRQKLNNANVIVCYLENENRSWPLWKQKHTAYKLLIPALIDSVYRSFSQNKTEVYLNGHSGGGSLLFGYMEGMKSIPSYVRRIGFLDANYGYDSSYLDKLHTWLRANKKNVLTVFAYDDSQVVFNGKPLVSEKGGTWYKSHQMMRELGRFYYLEQIKNDSIKVFSDRLNQVNFFLKVNPDKQILHTLQVEKNGFIHSILFGTQKENEGYEYYGQRAYTMFIK